MELWSLMHFLMPHVFQSHREFKEWFSNPVTGMIEGNSEYNDSIIKRLHKVSIRNALFGVHLQSVCRQSMAVGHLQRCQIKLLKRRIPALEYRAKHFSDILFPNSLQQLFAYSPPSIWLCFVWIGESHAIISIYFEIRFYVHSCCVDWNRKWKSKCRKSMNTLWCVACRSVNVSSTMISWAELKRGKHLKQVASWT